MHAVGAYFYRKFHVVVNGIGQMYMDEVTTDDLRLLMVPLSKGSSGMYYIFLDKDKPLPIDLVLPL